MKNFSTHEQYYILFMDVIICSKITKIMHGKNTHQLPWLSQAVGRALTMYYFISIKMLESHKTKC